MRFVIVCFLAALFIFLPCASAQFGYDKIDDDPISDYQTVDFFTKPRYNRVEGLFLHVGAMFKLSGRHQWAATMQAGYGIENQTFRYDAALEKRFFAQDKRLIVRGHIFEETASNQDWMVSEFENSLACFFMREDFKNYFGKRGWMVLGDQKFSESLLLRLSYSRHRYLDMGESNDFAWTLWKSDKNFRSNPAIVAGVESDVRLGLYLDKRDNPYFPVSGNLLEIVFSNTFEDFETQGLFITHYYYLPAFSQQRLVFKSMFGLRAKNLASQYLLNIGGLGSLRAFSEYERIGQNMVLVSGNYLFGGDIVQKLGLTRIPLLEAASFGVFVECGDAWNVSAPKKNIFSGLSGIDLLVDAGVSFLVLDGFIRFDFARELRGGNGDWRITLRLLDKF